NAPSSPNATLTCPARARELWITESLVSARVRCSAGSYSVRFIQVLKRLDHRPRSVEAVANLPEGVIPVLEHGNLRVPPLPQTVKAGAIPDVDPLRLDRFDHSPVLVELDRLLPFGSVRAAVDAEVGCRFSCCSPADYPFGAPLRAHRRD